jgi:acido-empty-quinoprotein group A
MKRSPFLFLAVALWAQKPEATWPSYNGDLTGQRHSPLKQINQANVDQLERVWSFKIEPGRNTLGNKDIKSTPVMVAGTLYFTISDHVWAVSAATGKQVWHYQWPSQGGIHIGNRGVAVARGRVYFETPDNHLVALSQATGRKLWDVEIADVKQEYFSTAAPMIVKDHVIVGVGGDSLDVPGYLEARSPLNGKLQWRWYTTPRAGQPGAETWSSKDSMEHGGGMTWMPGTYDAQLNLYILGTGNPNPVHAPQARLGDNLWTCSIVALNPDTGKLVWYYQVSPHDTHDWDAIQTPILIDGQLRGQRRKLVAQASRNGYYFLLDRTTGEHITTAPFVKVNWSKGINAKGQPIPDPAKDPKTDAVIVSPGGGGGPNWHAPAFNPQTGLLYVNAAESASLFYLTDTGDNPHGYGGREVVQVSRAWLKALDYKTGQVKWSHQFPGRVPITAGILSTAGQLLFTGDIAQSLIAFDPATGAILWHANLGTAVSNGPITYQLGGKQYLVAGAGETLHAFALK